VKRSPFGPRKKPMNRAKAMTQRIVAAKRAKVTAEERAARKAVRARSGGICEGCGERPARDWAHRVGRGQGGPWCASNGLDLCNPGGCHDRAHASPEWARSMGWILRSGQDPTASPALLAGRGWVLLRDDGGFDQQEDAA